MALNVDLEAMVSSAGPWHRIDGAARDDPLNGGRGEVDASHGGTEFTQPGRQGAGDEAVRARDEHGGGQRRGRTFGADRIHDRDGTQTRHARPRKPSSERNPDSRPGPARRRSLALRGRCCYEIRGSRSTV